MKNLKKTLALISALALSATALVSCGDDSSSKDSSKADSSSKSDSSDKDSKDDKSSEEDSEGGEVKEPTLPVDGDTFTVVTWNTEFTDYVKTYYAGYSNETEYTDAMTVKNAKGEDVKLELVSLGTDGGGASAALDLRFQSGDKTDLYCTEADWALYYLDNDKVVAPISALGIDESEIADQYQYTKDIGKNSKGEQIGLSFQAAPGGWAYRTDLAEKHLNIKTPEEMQEAVKDWDTFEATAKTLKEKTGGATAMTATLGGMWQVFSSNRTQKWVDADGKLAVDDSCTEFMNMAKTFVDEKYTTKIDQWGEGWTALGTNDGTLGYFISTWGMGGVILGAAAGNVYNADGTIKTEGPTNGKWAFVEGPQSYFWGGTWLVAHADTDNADLCADVMRHFTIEYDSMKKYAEGTGDFTNNKKVMKDIVDAKTNKNPVLNGQDQFAVFLEAADGVSLSDLITPYDASIKSCFAEGYKGYAVKGTYKNVDEAIEGFKNEVAAKVKGVTVD